MYKVTAIFLLGLVALTCGFPTVEGEATERFFGGTEAGAFDATFMVSVREDTDHSHLCGGALITTRTVLTAATCIYEFNLFRLYVIVGSNTLNTGGDIHRTLSIRYHPGFQLPSHRDDIALIVTRHKVILGDRVTLIPIRSAVLEDGVSATFFGWGNVRHPGSVGNYLQKLNTRTIAAAGCSVALANSELPVRVKNVCTFTREGEGICTGDIGGPLVANGKLIGIASWSMTDSLGNCAIGLPDVFTRVDPYYDWIKANSISESDDEQ